MAIWKRRRVRHTRERLSSLGDVAVVATAAVFAISFMMNVVIRVGGLIFPRIFDPLSETVGMSSSTAQSVAVLGEITAFQAMLGATVLGAAAIGIASMVLSILAWSFRRRGLMSVACSCVVMAAMSTPLPDNLLALMLNMGAKPWAVVPGAHEALTATVADVWSTNSVGMLLGMAAATLLSWYRVMLLLPDLPGMRMMPPSLRPAD